MKAIITQREASDDFGGLVDILESNYVHYFESLGMELIIISNFHKNINDYLKNIDYDFVILTGGGSVPPDFYEGEHVDFNQKNRDSTEKMIIETALKSEIPIIGICRGMQFINGIFGGKISKLSNLKVKRPIGIDHSVIVGNNHTINVNNFHNDGIIIDNLAKNFEMIALDHENRIVEAFYSRNLRTLGLQWHPERKFIERKGKQFSDNLLQTFIKERGLLDESYYISCRSRY